MRNPQFVDRYPLPQRFIVTLNEKRLQKLLPSVPRNVAEMVTAIILLISIFTAVIHLQATFDKAALYVVELVLAPLSIILIAILYQLDNEKENLEITRQNNLMRTAISKKQTALDKCYHNYLNNPIHQKMEAQCEDYYASLKYHSALENELRQAPYLARLYAKEDTWLAHIQPFPHLLLYEDFYHTPRGKRLETMGLMMMHDFYSRHYYSMPSLREYFSMAEIRKFLPLHRQLVNSYTYVENEQDINDLKITFIQEIEEEMENSLQEYQQSLDDLKMVRSERLQTYRIFCMKYEQLIKQATAVH